MDTSGKSTHTLCERILIFLYRPRVETFQAIFNDRYATITLVERNILLGKEESKTKSDSIQTRKVVCSNSSTEFNIKQSLDISKKENPNKPNNQETPQYKIDSKSTLHTLEVNEVIETVADNNTAPQRPDSETNNIGINPDRADTEAHIGTDPNKTETETETNIGTDPNKAETDTETHIGTDSNKSETETNIGTDPNKAETDTETHIGTDSNKSETETNIGTDPNKAETDTETHIGTDSNRTETETEAEAEAEANIDDLGEPGETFFDSTSTLLNNNSLENNSDFTDKLLTDHNTNDKLSDEKKTNIEHQEEKLSSDSSSSSATEKSAGDKYTPFSLTHKYQEDEKDEYQEAIEYNSSYSSQDGYDSDSSVNSENNINESGKDTTYRCLVDFARQSNHHILAPMYHKDGPVIEVAKRDHLRVNHYTYNENQLQYTIQPTTEAWIEEQQELAYRIITNDEVDPILAENAKHAITQQNSQSDNPNFSSDTIVNPKTNIDIKIEIIEHNEQCGVATSKGNYRHNMEDRYVVQRSCKDNFMFGVFDGHGGSEISQNLSQDMSKAIENELYTWSNVKYKNKSTDTETIAMSKKACHVNALTMAHVVFDKNIITADNVGSTSVTTCMIDENIYVSNLGDSRAILMSPDGTIVQLTEDAKVMTKVDEKYKMNRHTYDVLKRGGYIPLLAHPNIDNPNVNEFRINCNLLTSKAFGDKKLLHTIEKGIEGIEGINESDMRYTLAVSARPDIVCVEKPKNGWDGYKLLLCSDGLLDVASTKQIGQYVHDETTNEKSMSYGTVASNLIRMAANAGSKDNMAVLIFNVTQMQGNN